MASKKPVESSMDTIISLSKRRGFIYPSSEIYGGFAGIYDLGPMGVELANNIKTQWWNVMVRRRKDIVGLDSAIFMHPKIWVASGHVAGFSDPLIECKDCHARSRADKLLEEIGIQADEKMSEDEINKLLHDNKDRIVCPSCGKKNFTEAKKFNLLVKSNLGDFSSEGKEPAYLRGETCQGIYVNYKNIIDTMHVKVPFGIAQIGKAFRNEIAPRQFVFRCREFEQMEMQYFLRPENEMSEYDKLKEYRFNALVELGLKKENIRWKKHENLVFYAKAAYDIEYKFPFGWDELEGVHARGNYDLTQHSMHSGEKLDYFDQEKGERYTPHIIESSGGVGRLVLAMLVDSYNEEEVNGETRVVLRLPRKIAPVKVAILPLSKKDELTAPSEKIFDTLKDRFSCVYDETQSIGKRYRRQDEIGTPYCVTFDFDSLKDDAVTVRDRDTMTQDRVKIADFPAYLEENLK
ncbi:MAG: glycine--tRNA ligase [Candidatus Yonathbacteria bacterium CG_4_8_14_3_um_filter_46_25]|nr:MAG: glycine--tRNA ligase [Candidatus Yonathbacteria bacterium CG_4_8_14_3_um_filter_46_25]